MTSKGWIGTWNMYKHLNKGLVKELKHVFQCIYCSFFSCFFLEMISCHTRMISQK